MPETMNELLISQLKPVFPQFQEDGLKNVVELVKNDFENQPGQQAFATAANLLPLCINFLLDREDGVIPVENNIINEAFLTPVEIEIPANDNNSWPKARQKKENKKKNSGFIRQKQANTSSSSNVSSTTRDSDSESSSDSDTSSDDEREPKRMEFNLERRSLPSSSYSSGSSTNSSSTSSNESDVIVIHSRKSVYKQGNNVKTPENGTPNGIIFVNKVKNNKQVVVKSGPTVVQSTTAKTITSNTTKTTSSVGSVKTPENGTPDGIIFVNKVNNNKQVGVKSGPTVVQSTTAKTITSTKTTSSIGSKTIGNNSVDVGVTNAVPNGQNLAENFNCSNVFEEALTQVFLVIPDVERNFAINLVMRYAGMPSDMIANNVVEQLFEMPYPKLKSATESPKRKEVETKVDYLDVKNLKPVAEIFRMQCLILLLTKFKAISSRDITIAMNAHGGHYAATVKYLEKVTHTGHHCEPAFCRSSIKFTKGKRLKQKVPAVLDHNLQKEIDFLEAEEKQSDEELVKLAESLENPSDEDDLQSAMECGCCFGESPLRHMVQCMEGHLFCDECLKSYAKEAIFGGGKTQLLCMTAECTSRFPLSQLERALTKKMLEKYNERLQDESIKMAELPDLVRCPACDFAAELPPNDKVFRCLNESCKKETCRYCQEEWKEHFGIPCSEMEKKDAKNIRVSYEEKMSMAKIRTCPKCKCGFTKTDGCNKMTCRCGTTMCYICRKSNIGYNHFCNHPRDPGKTCVKCKHCSLWTKAEEDDERAIKELKKEAIKESEKLQPSSTGPTNATTNAVGSKRPLLIGAPDERDQHRHSKKRKTHNHR